MKALNLDTSSLASNPRASLRSWTRYAPLVLEAYEKHPVPLSFTPTHFAASTIVLQLRDAIRGALAFHHPFPPGHEALLRWWGEVAIRQVGDQVIIGPREKKDVAPLAVSSPDSFSYETLSLDEIEAFRTLLNTGVLSGPITVRKFDVSYLNLFRDLSNTIYQILPDGSLRLI